MHNKSCPEVAHSGWICNIGRAEPCDLANAAKRDLDRAPVKGATIVAEKQRFGLRSVLPLMKINVESKGLVEIRANGNGSDSVKGAVSDRDPLSL